MANTEKTRKAKKIKSLELKIMLAEATISKFGETTSTEVWNHYHDVEYDAQEEIRQLGFDPVHAGSYR